MKKLLKHVLPLILILLLLAGCGDKKKEAGVNGGYSYDYGYAMNAEPAEAYAMSADTAFGARSAKSAAVYEADEEAPAPEANGSGLPANRKIIRNADVTLQTLEYEAFLKDTEAKIIAMGGYVQSSTTGGNSYNTRSGNRSATYTARIPADKLDAFLDAVSVNANVTSRNIYTTDVTGSYTDIEMRLTSLRTELDTLNELLKRAIKMEDIITIYERIADVQYEIESYQGSLNRYDDQIAYSTVKLTVKEVQRVTVSEPETRGAELKRRLKENLQDVGDGFLDFGVWFISSLPMLILWAILIAAIVLFIRWRVKKIKARREKRRAARDAAIAAVKEAARKGRKEEE